jgi:hypothetical protein
VSDEPRTFDLRLWLTADPPGPALETFFADVVELAQRHPGIEPRWFTERRDRHGRPRIARVRVHVPPRLDVHFDNPGHEPKGGA